jgi:hypothetical protein
MSDDKKPFTVTDRRHFTAEGRARETEPPETAPAPPPPSRPEPEPERARVTPSPAPEPQVAEPERADTGGFDDDEMGAEGDDDLPAFPTDLLGLIGSLATQATMLLAGDPQARRPPGPAELDAVRSIIALLDVLHEKTKNNRDAQEDRVLDGVRYELKMAFVARTRAGGA